MDNLIFGCRIPYNYFTTIGGGEANVGGGDDDAAFETGSYDAALNDANIEDFNIIKYTSVIPSQSIEVTLNEAKKSFVMGSVLETIMAQKNGVKGEKITAAVLLTAIYKKVKDKPVYMGSYAVEYSGQASPEEARSILCKNATNLCIRRRFGSIKNSKIIKFNEKMLTDKNYILHADKFIVKSMTVKKQFGTVLAAIGFISYINPIFRPPWVKKYTQLHDWKRNILSLTPGHLKPDNRLKNTRKIKRT
jgi:arginine decarboxylase